MLMTWLWFFLQLNYAKTNMVLWNTKIRKERWKQKRMTNKMKRMKKETHLSSKAIIHGKYYNEALLAQAYQEPQQIKTRPTNNEIPSVLEYQFDSSSFFLCKWLPLLDARSIYPQFNWRFFGTRSEYYPSWIGLAWSFLLCCSSCWQ